MKYAYKSKHEYEKSQEQGDFVLPFLEVRGYGFDSESLLDALASYWNDYFALNCAGTVFSVLKFFTKNEKFVYGLRRSFQVLSIRFRFVFI